MKKRTKRRITAAASAAMLFALSAGSLHAAAFDNNVKSGTVAVVFYLKNVEACMLNKYDELEAIQQLEDGEYSGGSGFFIGESGKNPQYILTNCHVIEEYVASGEGGEIVTLYGYTYDDEPVYLHADSCELRIYYSSDDYDIAYVDCFGDSEKVDLAVLRIKDATEKRHTLKLQEPSEDMVGDTVYTVGYPGNADNDFSGASHYGIDDATVHKGAINRFVMNEGKGVERIAIDATVQHGNSGGPLVNEDGYVLGINTNVESNVKYGTQVEVDYYAINTTEVIRFLDKNNIPYETASGGEKGMSGIVICAVAALTAAGGACAFALTNKKQKQSAAASAVKPQAGAAAPAAAVPGRGIIRAMSPQLGGRVFPVTQNPIVIGRTAECGIVFPEGTPGVSSRHCSVTYQAGTFVLTDLGSTYGTFLSSGVKLNPNAPTSLRPGDSFYVGDKANGFRLEAVQ